MVKKKFSPFTHYKWSWFDWPGPRERCSLFYESKLMKSLDWEDAYWCCRDDVEYIDKYECRLENRNSVKSVCLFLVLMLTMSIVVAVATYFCCDRTWIFPFIIPEVFVLILVGITLRTIYYRGMDFDLHHADNRINSLAQVWPDIVDIVCDDIDNDSIELPPEPQKTPDFEWLNMAVSASERIMNLNLSGNDTSARDDKIVADLIDNLKLGISEEEPTIDEGSIANLDVILSEITKEIEALSMLLKKGS